MPDFRKTYKFIQSSRFQQIAFACIAFLLAVYVLFNPFKKDTGIEDTGVLLIWAAILVFIQGYKRSSVQERKSAHTSALFTLLLGFLLVNASLFRSDAVYGFTFLIFAIDATRQLIGFIKARNRKMHYWAPLLTFLANLGVLAAFFFSKGLALEVILSVASALRIASMGIEILYARIGVMKEVGDDVVVSLGLQDHPEIENIARNIEKDEATRAPIDRYWITLFIVLLFFIHLGRMGLDRSATGVLSPFVALVGDIVIAVILAYAIIIPGSNSIRKVVRPFERNLWLWVIAVPENKMRFFSVRRFVQYRLKARTRNYIRIRKAGYSFKTAFRMGLQVGLPYAALLAAIIPVFGMSWYFDTENWASGIWDNWAAKRTDIWRSTMVKAVQPNPNAESFKINIPGLTDNNTFSFLVIGDPGEGDASQYVLHDQIVHAASNENVKFIVISSDVVYPDGAMKDYERNFWLPMKGVHVPVLAIPGNHDWYDALEGFAATFYDSTSASISMKARREVDLNLNAKTKKLIHSQIMEAERLRNEYDVPTGFQQAPYFQLQTKDFAFICIETGVMRRIDDMEMKWLKSVLEASKGKFLFVLLGHPFYAAGEYQGNMNNDFAALHQLLRDYGATIAMAGDTHDLEYYLEPLKGKDTGKVMHHFVNGGGGAYLSLGAALKPVNEMPEKVWAHYPSAGPLVDKIEKNTGPLKQPAWLWTKQFNGWPFSAEWLSAAFDYNRSPFFQSFIEVQVDPTQNFVKLKAHGIKGLLKWSDLAYSPGLKPDTVSIDAPVEWIYPLKKINNN